MRSFMKLLLDRSTINVGFAQGVQVCDICPAPLSKSKNIYIFYVSTSAHGPIQSTIQPSRFAEDRSPADGQDGDSTSRAWAGGEQYASLFSLSLRFGPVRIGCRTRDTHKTFG